MKRALTTAAILILLVLAGATSASAAQRVGDHQARHHRADVWYTVQRTATRYTQTYTFPTWCCSFIRMYRNGNRVAEYYGGGCDAIGVYRGQGLWGHLWGCSQNSVAYIAEGPDPVVFTFVYQ